MQQVNNKTLPKPFSIPFLQNQDVDTEVRIRATSAKTCFNTFLQIYRKVGMSNRVLFPVLLLTLLSGMFDAGSIGLLIPLMKGMIQLNFHFVEDVFILRYVTKIFDAEVTRQIRTLTFAQVRA